MDRERFKAAAKELAIAACLQYQEIPEGDIMLIGSGDDGTYSTWIAEMGHDGQITRVTHADGDRVYSPETWLAMYIQGEEPPSDSD